MELRITLIAALVAALLASGYALYINHASSLRAEGRAEVRAQWSAATEAANAATRKREQANAAAAQAAAEAAESDRARWAKTLKNQQLELRRATSNLAACRLGLDAIRVLNSAASAANLQPAD